jgi:hypothetical protein
LEWLAKVLLKASLFSWICSSFLWLHLLSCPSFTFLSHGSLVFIFSRRRSWSSWRHACSSPSRLHAVQPEMTSSSIMKGRQRVIIWEKTILGGSVFDEDGNNSLTQSVQSILSEGSSLNLVFSSLASQSQVCMCVYLIEQMNSEKQY